jgi:hypothetical protein
MKQVFMMALLMAICFAACEKSELPPPPMEAKATITGGAKVWIPVGAFDTLKISNRNGYYPFNSPWSFVDHDIFNSVTVHINNLNMLDSAVYQRINNDRNMYLGILWNPFKVRYYYDNGRDTIVTRLVPAYIADKETRIPIVAYNQLHSGNNEHWVRIMKTNRRDRVLSPYCGILVWRWTYNVVTSSGTDVNVILDSNCSNQLQYQMVI